MSELTIHHDQLRNFKTVPVGERVTYTITGIVRSVEDDLVDISPTYGDRQYATGRRTTTITLTTIQPAAGDTHE